MNKYITNFIIIFGSAISAGIGDFCSKKYSINLNNKWIFGITLSYIIGTFFWIKMLRNFDTLAQAGKIWVLASTIVMLFISQILFKESITNCQWFGIFLGLISLFLML